MQKNLHVPLDKRRGICRMICMFNDALSKEALMARFTAGEWK